MSPTAMWTTSRSPPTNPPRLPFPLPWAPMMTSLRTWSGYRSRAVRSGSRAVRSGALDPGVGSGLVGAERELLLAQPPQLQLEGSRDLGPVRFEQLGVDEPDDVVVLAL